MAFFLPPTSQRSPKTPETPPKTNILDLKPLPQLPSAHSSRASEADERNAAHWSSSPGKWWKNLRPSRRPEKGSTFREAGFQDDSETTQPHLHPQATEGHSTRRGGTTDSGYILDWNVPTVIHDPSKDTQPPPQRVVSAHAVTDSSDMDDRRFSFAPKAQVPEQLSLGKQTCPDKKVAFQEPPHESEPTDESKMQASYLADRRLSLTRRAIEAKKELRRQRRHLKESSDFLGVQGFNPRTGTEDSLTSSSTANNEGSGDVTNEKANALRQAKRDVLNSRSKEAQAQQKSRHSPSRPSRGVTWRRHTNEWSSIQDPGVSLVAQSPRSDPNDSHSMSLAIDKTDQTSPQLPIMERGCASNKFPPPLRDLGAPSSATGTKMMPDTMVPELTSEVGSPSSSILIHNRPRQSSARTLYAGELYENDIRFDQSEDSISYSSVHRGDLSADTRRGGIKDFDEEAKMAKPAARDSFLGTWPVSKPETHQGSDTGFPSRHQPMAEMLQLTHGTPERSPSLLPAEVGKCQLLEKGTMHGDAVGWMREKENIPTLQSHQGIIKGTIDIQCQEESALRMPFSTPTIITTGSERKTNGISQGISLKSPTVGLEEKATDLPPAKLAASYAVAQSLPVLSSRKLNSPLSSTPGRQMTRSDTMSTSGKGYPSKRFVRRRSVANVPDLRRAGGSVQRQTHRRHSMSPTSIPALGAAQRAFTAREPELMSPAVHDFHIPQKLPQANARIQVPIIIAKAGLGALERNVPQQTMSPESHEMSPESHDQTLRSDNGLTNCQNLPIPWTPEQALPGSYPWELDDADDDIVGHFSTIRNNLWPTHQEVAWKIYSLFLGCVRLWWSLTRPVFDPSSDYWARNRNDEATLLDSVAFLLSLPGLILGMMVLV